MKTEPHYTIQLTVIILYFSKSVGSVGYLHIKRIRTRARTRAHECPELKTPYIPTSLHFRPDYGRLAGPLPTLNSRNDHKRMAMTIYIVAQRRPKRVPNACERSNAAANAVGLITYWSKGCACREKNHRVGNGLPAPTSPALRHRQERRHKVTRRASPLSGRGPMYRLAFIVLLSTGCGMDSALPLEPKIVRTCRFDNVVVQAERTISCAQVQKNVGIAYNFMDTLQLSHKYAAVFITLWDRQLLYCDQQFLGLCVHFIKGDSNGSSQVCRINVNNGGELLLHEFLHCAVYDPDHKTWARRGFSLADWMYRVKVGYLRAE